MIPVYNRPDFIEMQCRLFSKFLKDDYRLIFFNDADNDGMKHSIEEMCARYNAECIRIPQEIHLVDPQAYRVRASFRHGEVLDFMFQNYGFKHNDLITVMDSDMFLIREFSIREYLEGYDMNCYGNYITTHFGVFDPSKLKDTEAFSFRARFLPDGSFVDVAEASPAYVLQQNVRKKQVDILWGLHRDLHLDPSRDRVSQLKERGYTDSMVSFLDNFLHEASMALLKYRDKQVLFELDIGLYELDLFLDYKHGSGWHNPSPESSYLKNQLVKNFINSILNQ